MAEKTAEVVRVYRGGWLPDVGVPIVVVASGEGSDGGLYAEYFAVFPDAGGEHWALRLTISKKTISHELGINREFVERKAILHAEGDINQRVYDRYKAADEKWPLPDPITLAPTEGVGELVALKLEGAASAALGSMRRLTQSRRLEHILDMLHSLDVAKMMPLE
jgi:hypothetical protein